MEVIKKPRTIALLVIAIIALSTIGWYVWDTNRERLILATTTSTYDSGLLDELVPEFESQYHVYVDIISVGTGQAIETARTGDADIILVHSRSRELEFVNGGYGYHRIGIMYNDFVIVGPSSDPANIRGLNNVTEAFIRIKDAGNKEECIFLSRGDNSGTHTKEVSIWAAAGIEPSVNWYLEIGQGMGTTIQMANEEQTYTLADRGTWLSWKSDVTLEILTEGDLILLNPYGVIPVNPEKHSHVKNELAIKFVKYLISTETQQMIGDFKKEGEVLFKPIARDVTQCVNLGFPNQAQELNWYDTKQ
jgi:tungstate transport system substrate-binding protein